MEKTRAKPASKTARTSYEAHADDKGFKKVPALAVVKASMSALASRGEEANNRNVAAELRADGYDVDAVWTGKFIHHNRLTRAVAVQAIREVQADRARTLGEVIDLAPAFHANAAVKNAITTIAVRIARDIEAGIFPMPQDAAEAKALLSVLAMAEQATSEAQRANIESALLVPGGLADGARDVSPAGTGRFARLIDG